MNQDQQTYQRAVGVALAGLVIQIIFSVAILVLALSTQAPYSAVALMYHTIGGVLLWIALAVVFYQHRLERIESLETEQIALRQGRQSSIFETAVDELSVARRRLEKMYRWLLPITSVITSVYLIAIGVWQFRRWLTANAEVRSFEGVLSPANPLVSNVPEGQVALIALAACGALAFVGFIFSRYVAGMAKADTLGLLRGGAGFLMGTVLMLLLVGVGLGFARYGNPYILHYVGFVVPLISIVIGIEIALNFLLDFYRPRQAGEQPRPAFDSRLLSLLTSPESIATTINEAINYQFGFEITQSWFWQLLSRAFAGLLVFAVLVMVGLSCIVVVEPHERGIVTRFGQITSQPLEPGIHFKLPWPISTMDRYNTTRVRTITVGSHASGAMPPEMPILWTNYHAGRDESYLLLAPPDDAVLTTGERAGERAPVGDGTLGDPAEATTNNLPSRQLAGVEIFIDYRIGDLLNYITGYDDPDTVFRAIADETVSQYLLRHDIDALVGDQRFTAAEELAELIREAVHSRKLGIEVVWVGIAGVHPAQDVAEYFEAVIGSRHERNTLIEQGLRQAIEALAAVAGSSGYARRIDEQIALLGAMRAASPQSLADQLQKTSELMETYIDDVDARQALGRSIAQLLGRDTLDEAWTQAADQLTAGIPDLVDGPDARRELMREVRILLAIERALIDADAVAVQEALVESMVIRAGGTAAQQLAAARAARWITENAERGRAAGFASEQKLYNAAPTVYRLTKIYDALLQRIGEARVYFIAGDRDRVLIRGDFSQVDTDLTTMDLTGDSQ